LIAIPDIQEDNILLGMNEKTAEQDFDKFEETEMTSPTARKIDGDRVIYSSRSLVPPVSRSLGTKKWTSGALAHQGGTGHD